MITRVALKIQYLSLGFHKLAFAHSKATVFVFHLIIIATIILCTILLLYNLHCIRHISLMLTR